MKSKPFLLILAPVALTICVVVIWSRMFPPSPIYGFWRPLNVKNIYGTGYHEYRSDGMLYKHTSDGYLLDIPYVLEGNILVLGTPGSGGHRDRVQWSVSSDGKILTLKNPYTGSAIFQRMKNKDDIGRESSSSLEK